MVEGFSDFLSSWSDQSSEFEIKTSGSTGPPKSISLTRSALRYSAEQTAIALKLDPDTRILCCIDTNRIGGFMMWVRAAHLGLAIETIEPVADPMEMLPEDHDFTFVSLVPYQLYQILKNNESIEKLNRFKTVLLGGAPLSENVHIELSSMQPRFHQSYGMTETCSHVAIREVSDENEGYSAIGDVELKQDDDGCLIVSGTVTNSKELNTGDIVEIDAENRIHWKGRRDNVINSGGVKIIPEEIELELRVGNDELVLRNYFVTSLPDSILGEKLVLVVEGAKMDIPMAHLSKYNKPKEVYFLDNFVFTANSKLDRKKTTDLLSLQS
jgi:O-succinylbenzoic acid--CoA ligase